MTPESFQRMARYNRWANRRLFEACTGLDDTERKRDRQAFFGSIHGTLNHILVADRIWLSRLNGQPHGIKSLDQTLFDDFGALDEALAVTGQVTWNKFLAVVTLEATDDPSAAAWAGPIVPEVKPWAEEQLATLPANVRPYFIDRNIRRADFNVANKPADMADQATGLNPSRWD